MVEGLSTRASKQVIISEPRKGFSAQVAINHEPGHSINTVSSNSLKKSGPESKTRQKLTER